MDHGGMKLSGDGTVFLLLLNQDDSEETEGLNGKDRLRHALKFEGELLVLVFDSKLGGRLNEIEMPGSSIPGRDCGTIHWTLNIHIGGVIG